MHKMISKKKAYQKGLCCHIKCRLSQYYNKINPPKLFLSESTNDFPLGNSCSPVGCFKSNILCILE